MRVQHKLEAKIMTVREILQMIVDGKLQYDTTTQRQFIYNNKDMTKLIPTTVTGCGTMTKAGYVIYNIFNRLINLPPLLLWYNTDTDTLNIHDGKQRALSLLNFVLNGTVATYVDGDSILCFDALSEDDQNFLLDYQFVVQITYGNSLDEEESFYEINSNSENLTAYENLHAVMYGRYLTEFEQYLETCNLTNIKANGRGEQAYKLLLAMYRISNSKQAGTGDLARQCLRDELRSKRNEAFDPTYKRFEDVLRMFNALLSVKFAGNGSKSLSEEIAIAITTYAVDHYYARLSDVIDLYIRAGKQRNDILKWASDFNNSSIQTHKTFIDAFLNEGLELDPRRFFDESEVQAIIARDGCRCRYIDEATGDQCAEVDIKKLDADHKIPWSLGGRTNIQNGQLLCKHHNRSKGNRV
jgi:hypothetical protein